jgi:hypothetical protein
MTITIELPESFPFKTNMGLHGDTQFFEVSADHQMTIAEPVYEGDKIHFVYQCWDSDEGSVTISYQTISGEDAMTPEEDEGWDVEITSGSDVWGLAETAAAVRDAVALHTALGRDVPFAR